MISHHRRRPGGLVGLRVLLDCAQQTFLIIVAHLIIQNIVEGANTKIKEG